MKAIDIFPYILCLVLLVALALLSISVNSNSSDSYDLWVFDSDSCSESLACESAGYDYYAGDVESHLLEVRYKCLTLLNCKGE